MFIKQIGISNPNRQLFQMTSVFSIAQQGRLQPTQIENKRKMSIYHLSQIVVVISGIPI